MNVAMHAKHEDYSPTSVEWIDEVPEGWEIIRIQDFATFNDDVINERAYRTRQIKYVDIGGVDAVSNTYTFEAQDFRSAPSRARRLARSGDTVFSTVRPYLKAVATIMHSEEDLVFSTGFAVIRPRHNADARFVGYVLRNDRFIDEVTANSVGASYPAINATDLVKLHVLLPPLPEQRAIAAFLDEKCAKIDEAVRIREAQIALLQERRQILIQQAVTRGLNPDAPMKDSGIDWIGQIPAHWDVKRLRNLSRIHAGNGFPLELQGEESGTVPFLKVSDFKADTVYVFEANNMVSEQVARIMKWNIVPQGSLITAKIGEALRKNHRNLAGRDCIIDNNCIAFEPVDIDTMYFYWLHRVIDFDWFVNPGAVPSISVQKYRSEHVAIPPFDEQKEIVQHISLRTEEIDKALSLKQSQITTLKEYKTVLINAAVTGKIKVTEGQHHGE